MRASSFCKRQDGLVLYVAMMMLIVLSLLGLVGMQVASMQERMVSNYYLSNLAFQNAEKSVRAIETALEAQGAAYPVNGSGCSFDALAWARAQAVNQVAYVRRLECEASPGSPGAQWKGKSDEGARNSSALLYEITVLASDVQHEHASTSVLIQTIYLPYGSKGQSGARDQKGLGDSSNAAIGISAHANKSFPYGRQSWRQLR